MNFLRIFSLSVLVLVTMSPSMPAQALIGATDYFQLTAAGNATTMDAGGSLVFTLNAKTAIGGAKELAGSDYATISMWPMMGGGGGTSLSADITAIGGGATIKSSAAAPWGEGTTAADVDGTNDKLIAVNLDVTGTGTFTVTATESFGVCVGAEGASINMEDSGDFGDGGTPPGSDCQMITVGAATSGADHLRVTASATSVEPGIPVTITVTQENAGGGLVTSELSDVNVGFQTISGTPEPYFVSIDGVPTGNTTTTVAPSNSLSSGTFTAVIAASAPGQIGISTTSPLSNPIYALLTIGSATDMTIQGYGPMNGQVGAPTMAPVDFQLSKDPSSSLSFPLTNTTESAFSITTGGAAVPGQWNYFSESWGTETFYKVSFSPSSPLLSSTPYSVSVTKAFAPALSLPEGMPTLTSGDTTWTSTFTTGTGGGDFMAGGEFSGDMGGKFPPMAMMGYPLPGQWDVPTNVECVIVDFDRPMNPSALTLSNIYIKKIVNGALSETLPGGAAAVSIVGGNNDSVGGNNDSVCISGYTLEASSDYCVIVDNDVTSASGDTLAGMPGTTDAGCGSSGTGFGFSNMGPFEEKFHTGTGSTTVTAAMMGTNLNQYKSGSLITGVPVGFIPRVTFNAPLNPSTIGTTSVTLKKNGTISTAGSVYYNADGNAIEFVPNAVLSASTSYTLNISTSVTSISGTAISAISQSFTTGTADVTSPQVVFADADNYGVSIQFDEPLNKTTAENKSYYTIKTCSQAEIAADGLSCTGGGDVSSVSLISGVNSHYENSDNGSCSGNSVWMDGLTLTPGDGFYVGVSTSVTDIAGNGFHATNNRSWTGKVMDGSKFGNGQGMFNECDVGMDDFNMKNMGMMPVGAFPNNSMAGATTKYFIDLPITSQIPADGYIELTFPMGFDVSGVKRDAYSPANADFNGPGQGTVTFDTTIPSAFTDGLAVQANDGIGYVSAARRVAIQLASATEASDFLHIDLDGITNSTEAVGFDSAGYQVTVKTYNSSGTMLESLKTMPFFISSAGTNTISGQITSGVAGVNGVRIFLDSLSSGGQETTTANNANGGGLDGEYLFENLADGNYHLFIEPSDGYFGKEISLGTITSPTTKNIALDAMNGTTSATLPISINIADIGSISSLGFGDSIDVFGWNTTGQGGFVRTLTRSQVVASVATPVEVYLPSVGNYNIGIGPALPKGDFAAFPEMNWMPPANQTVSVTSTNIGGSAMSTKAYAVTAPDATISGIVKDSSGAVITSGKVSADFAKGGFAGESKISSTGTFSIPVQSGKTYKIGSSAPGMPPGTTHSVKVDTNGNVFVDGSPTASTGNSGLNPFIVKFSLNVSSSLTISGRVSDGTSAIQGAGVWAHRTDQPMPPVDTFTDESGNYILYIPSAGTWQVEAHSPGLGFLGSKTLTVTTESFASQNFEPLDSSLMGSIGGTIDIPGTSDDSGVVVWAHNPNGFFNEGVTAEDGSYSFEVPIDTDSYTVEAWHPNAGNIMKTTQVVDGSETVNPGVLPDPATVTIAIGEAVSEDVYVDFKSTTGTGKEVVIPAGETFVTTVLPEGTFYMDLEMPFDDSGVTVSGAEFNNVNDVVSTDSKVNFDGTGDNITITLPTLNTVGGTISDANGAVADVVVTVVDESTRDTFSVVTESDGTYEFKLPDGDYSILTEQAGYFATPESVSLTGNVNDQDFTMVAADQTIEGTITDSLGAPVEGALVYAELQGGGIATATTESDGTYSMNVVDGVWEVVSVTDGYLPTTALTVEVSGGDVLGADAALPVTTVALDDPTTTSITKKNPTSYSDQDLGIGFTLPANSIDANSTLSFTETNELPDTSSATPFSTGISIDAKTTNDSTPVTQFDNDAKLTFEYTVAQLIIEGVDTPTELGQTKVAYLNESTNNWTPMASTATYYDSLGAVIPKATVTSYDTLTAAATGADLATVELSAETDHLTTFAPIVSTGATPPATPTGLAATAGDTSVTLSWTANSEADMSSYNIWEANVTEGVLTTLAQSSCSGGTCSKAITGLTNGTAYAFQLAAVDTDGNKSAYSSAVSSTPAVASTPSSTPSGGGGSPLGGGSSGSSSSSSSSSSTSSTDASGDTEAASNEATSNSLLSANVVTEAYQVGEDGVVAESVTVMSEDNAALTIQENTVVTDADGNPYTGELAPAMVIASGDILAASNSDVMSDIFQIGVEGMHLFFDPPVSIQIPLSDSVASNYVVQAFYYDEASDGWKLAGDGGQMMKDADGNWVLVVDVDHLSQYVAMKTGEMEVVEDVTASGSGDYIFEDTANHWAKDFIEDLYLKGIVSGYDENHYGPDNNITRAEFTKIAVEAFNLPTLEASEITFMPFDDVSTDDWYAPYVQSAYVWNIVGGYEDGTFKPNKSINRAEAVRILFDAAKVDVATDYDAEFPDVDSGDWYGPYVNYAAYNKIVNGYEDGTFGPTKNLTRGEVAKVVSLMIKMYVEEADGVVGMVIELAS